MTEPTPGEMLSAVKAGLDYIEMFRGSDSHTAIAFRAVLARLEADQWRPIGEAPKDGKQLLWLLIPYSAPYEACVTAGFFANGCFRFFGDDGPEDIQPTHFCFCRFPAPPSDTPSSGGEG